MKQYKAVMEDGINDVIYSEESNKDFNSWKYEDAIPALRPQGQLIRFYIDGVEQHANDSRYPSRRITMHKSGDEGEMFIINTDMYIVHSDGRVEMMEDCMDQYKRYAIRSYRRWDGNDYADLYNYMGEYDNAIRFLNQYQTTKQTNL